MSLFLRAWRSIRPDRLLPVAAMLSIPVGMVLRIVFLKYVEFKGDEATALALTLQQWHGGGPAVTGLMSSIGLSNPPAFIWLLTLPVALSANPVWVTGCIATVNIIGLLLLYLFLRRYRSWEVAVWTVALMASAPWAILFSRKIWAQDLLPPLLFCLYGILLSLGRKYRIWKLLCLAVLLVVITQLHLSGLFLLPAVGLFLIISRIRIPLRDVCLALGIVLLLYAPYLSHQAAGGFLEFKTVIGSAHGKSMAVGAFRWALDTSTGIGFASVLGADGYASFASPRLLGLLEFCFRFYEIVMCCAVVWAAGTVLSAVAQRRKMTQWSEDLVVRCLGVLVILSVLLCYAILKVTIFPHYFIILYPIFPLLTAEFLGSFRRHPLAHTLGKLLLLVIILAQLLFSLRFLGFIVYHPDRITGDYGTPLILQGTGK